MRDINRIERSILSFALLFRDDAPNLLANHCCRLAYEWSPSSPLPASGFKDLRVSTVLWLCPLSRLHYNASMRDSPIDKMESQLEALIEGVFARMTRRPVQAREIAIMLLRALEDNATPPISSAAQPIAPDHYQITLHPGNANLSKERFPEMTSLLAQLIVEIGGEMGYQLNAVPQVSLHEDPQLPIHRVSVRAEHSPVYSAQTATMAPVTPPDIPHDLRIPLLTIDGDRFVSLTKSIINIGRAESNDIVIEDAFISRHHLQLRKRFGGYSLFDIQSRSGTSVNNIAVNEHQLQNGDVIQIGHTLLVYADAYGHEQRDGSTQVLGPR